MQCHPQVLLLAKHMGTFAVLGVNSTTPRTHQLRPAPTGLPSPGAGVLLAITPGFEISSSFWEGMLTSLIVNSCKPTLPPQLERSC